MEKILQILAGAFGALLLVMAVRWVYDPTGAAAAIQMALLDGPGRNSMIGDMGALFFGMGGFAVYGVWRKQPAFLFAASFLIGTAAALRIISGFAHDAPIIWSAVVFELVAAAIWITHGRKLSA